MGSSFVRKSLAASAVLASSVAATAGFAGAAQATPAGAANSPLTLDRGAWAPDGSRFAFVEPDGAIATARYAGSGAAAIVDPAKPGVMRSHPTWFAGGAAIVFSETVNGVSKIMSVPAYTAPAGPVQETSPLSFLGSHMPQGTETAPDSNGDSLAFQHRDAGTGHDQIWVQDSFGRGSGGPVLAADNGTSPSISPDGKSVAFLRKDGAGNEQIWTVPWGGQSTQNPAGTPVQRTTDAHDHLNPTFSPDGTRIAFEQGPGNGAPATDVESIAAGGGGQRQESARAGVPNYQAQNKDSAVRLSGDDRIGTAIAASQAQWITAPGPQNGSKSPAYTVVLSRSDQFADALGGSTLAEVQGGPLLLTPSDHLDPKVKAEIARVLGPAGTTKTVYVLGGEQALSPAVYNAVKSMGYTVKRIAGSDRYATSVAVAKQTTAAYGNGLARILVATGDNAPDALSAGAAAEIFEYPGPQVGVVVLSHDKVMPPATAAYLEDALAADPKPQVYGIGGQGDAALAGIGVPHTGLVGADRYQTSYLVAKTFFGSWQGTSPTSVGFATGVTWPDALSGGAFIGRQEGPLLLVDPVNGLSAAARSWVSGWAPNTDTAYVFGGTKAVPDAVAQDISSLISGPAGVTVRNDPKA
ncbi:MAG: cell wall-binding repeat-containing protein [Catenulispora sp.]